eukprot:XP_016879039.1 target of rapamycin complex subunit LST8 isoform X4 [Homo sapiens]
MRSRSARLSPAHPPPCARAARPCGRVAPARDSPLPAAEVGGGRRPRRVRGAGMEHAPWSPGASSRARAGHTMNTSPGTVGSDPVILATAGYDHTVRFWQAHSGICTRTVQHQDSQVNALEVTPDRSMIAAAGYQHIRMYDLNSNNPNPIISYDGVNKNIASVGFHEDGRWMYTGGEDCTARIWDLRCGGEGACCPGLGWAALGDRFRLGSLQAEAETGSFLWATY